MRRFPDEVKQNLGHQLRLLQRGERPTDYRPVATIGPGSSSCGIKMKELGTESFIFRGYAT
jgi:phage-related protein